MKDMTMQSDTALLTAIQPSSLNPRKHFDPVQLEELAESIRQFGLIEPIVVREIDYSGYDGVHPFPADVPGYEIIAGERRYRAASLAGLTEVPIRNLGCVDDHDALKLALIENLQRVDLDPIEEAEGYRQLHKIVGLKQAEIASAVNRSQPAVANAMRLLDLPDDVQELIRTRQLSVSHGIALCRYKGFPKVQLAIAQIAVANGTSAKALEARVPSYWDLERAGLVKRIAYAEGNLHFDACHDCPFNAKFSSELDGILCLNPSHYHQLEVAEEAAKTERVTAMLDAQSTTLDELPKTHDLDWSTYERVAKTAPDGCSADCSCRRLARDYNDEVIEICIQPRRYRRLAGAKERDEKKERQAHVAEQTQQLMDRIDAEVMMSGIPEALAIVCAAALRSISGPRPIVLSAARHVPELADKALWETWSQRGDAFAKVLSVASNRQYDQLFRMTFEALLRNEIANEYDTQHHWSSAYLARNSTTVEVDE